LSLQDQISQFLQQLSQLGYIGILAMSFIGASSIIFPVPYTIVIFLIASQYDPVLLAVFGGIGAALGEFTGYLLGFYGRRILSEERRRKMEALVKLFGRYGPLAIFLFALTPLPDDLLFIPLGIMRYKPVKAFIPALLGKILMLFILAYFGRVGANVILLIFGEGNMWVGMAVTAVLLTVVLVLLFRVDWEKVLQKYMGNRGEKKVESDS
jgi:membrane protein YqaA with SNARE-associated domain